MPIPLPLPLVKHNAEKSFSFPLQKPMRRSSDLPIMAVAEIELGIEFQL